MTTSVLTESELRSKLFKEFYKQNTQRSFNIKSIRKLLKEQDSPLENVTLINNKIPLNLYLPILNNLDRSHVATLPERVFSFITNAGEEIAPSNDNSTRNDLKYVKMKYAIEFVDIYNGSPTSQQKDIELFNKAYNYFKGINFNLDPNSQILTHTDSQIKKALGDYTLCITSAYVYLMNIWFSEFSKNLYTGFSGELVKMAMQGVNYASGKPDTTTFLIYSTDIYPAYQQYYGMVYGKYISDEIDSILGTTEATTSTNALDANPAEDISVVFNARSPISADATDRMSRATQFNAKLRQGYSKDNVLSWDPEKSLFDLIIHGENIQDIFKPELSPAEYAKNPNIGVQGVLDTFGMISLFSTKLRWVIANVVTSIFSATNRWRYLTYLRDIEQNLNTSGKDANILNNNGDVSIDSTEALAIVENSIFWHQVFLGLEFICILPFFLFATRVLARMKYRVAKAQTVTVDTYGLDKNREPVIFNAKVDGDGSNFFVRIIHSTKREVSEEYAQQALFDLSNLVYEKVLNPLKSIVSEEDFAEIIFKLKVSVGIEASSTEQANYFFTNTKTYTEAQVIDIAEKLGLESAKVPAKNGMHAVMKSREELIKEIYDFLRKNHTQFPSLKNEINETKQAYPDRPPSDQPFNKTKSDEKMWQDLETINPNLKAYDVQYDPAKKEFYIERVNLTVQKGRPGHFVKIFTSDWDAASQTFISKTAPTITATAKEFKNVTGLISELRKKLPGLKYKKNLKENFNSNALLNRQDALTVLYEDLLPKTLPTMHKIDLSKWPKNSKPKSQYLKIDNFDTPTLEKFSDETLCYFLNLIDADKKYTGAYDSDKKIFDIALYNQKTKSNPNQNIGALRSNIIAAIQKEKNAIELINISADDMKTAMTQFNTQKKAELQKLAQRSVNIANGMTRGLIIVNDTTIQSVLAPLIEALKRIELTLQYNLLRTEKLNGILLGDADSKSLADIANEFLEAGAQTAIITGAEAQKAFENAKKSLDATKGTVFDISGFDESTSLTLNFTGSLYDASSYGNQAVNMYRQYSQNLKIQMNNFVNVLQQSTKQITELKKILTQPEQTATPAAKYFYDNVMEKLTNIEIILNKGVNEILDNEILQQSGRNISNTYAVGNSKFLNDYPEGMTHDLTMAARGPNFFEAVKNIWNRLVNETNDLRSIVMTGEKEGLRVFVKDEKVAKALGDDIVVPNEKAVTAQLTNKLVNTEPIAKPVTIVKNEKAEGTINVSHAAAVANPATATAEAKTWLTKLGGLPKAIGSFILGLLKGLFRLVEIIIENPLASIVSIEVLASLRGQILMQNILQYTSAMDMLKNAFAGIISVLFAKLITVAATANSPSTKGIIKAFFGKFHRHIANFTKQGLILQDKVKEFKKDIEKSQAQRIRSDLLDNTKKLSPQQTEAKLNKYAETFVNNRSSAKIDSQTVNANADIIEILSDLQAENIINITADAGNLSIKIADYPNTNSKAYKRFAEYSKNKSDSDNINLPLKKINSQILMASFFTRWNKLDVLKSVKLEASGEKSWKIDINAFNGLSEQLKASFKKDYMKFSQYQSQNIYANLIQVPTYIKDNKKNTFEASTTNISNLYKNVCNDIDSLYGITGSFSKKLENISKSAIKEYYKDPSNENDITTAKNYLPTKTFTTQFGQIDEKGDNVKFRKEVIQYLHFMSILDEFFKINTNISAGAISAQRIKICAAIFGTKIDLGEINFNDSIVNVNVKMPGGIKHDYESFLKFKNAVKGKDQNIQINNAKQLIDASQSEQPTYVIILNRLIAFLGTKGFFTKINANSDSYLISRETINRLLNILYFYGHKVEKEQNFENLKKVYNSSSENDFDFNAMLTQGYSSLNLNEQTEGRLNVNLPYNSTYKYTSPQNYFEKISNDGDPYIVSELKLLTDLSESNSLDYSFLKVLDYTLTLVAPLDHSVHNAKVMWTYVTDTWKVMNDSPNLDELLNKKSKTKEGIELQTEGRNRKNRVILEHSYKKGRKLFLLKEASEPSIDESVLKSFKNPSIESIINGREKQYVENIFDNLDKINISALGDLKSIFNIDFDFSQLGKIIDIIKDDKENIKNAFNKLQNSEKFKKQILTKDFANKGILNLIGSDDKDYTDFIKKKTISEKYLQQNLDSDSLQKINNNEAQKNSLERSKIVNLLIADMIVKINNLSKKDQKIDLKTLYADFVDNLKKLYSNKDKNINDDEKNSENYKRLTGELEKYLEFFKNIATNTQTTVINFKNDKIVGYYSSDETNLIDRLVFVTDLSRLDPAQKNQLGLAAELNLDYINNLNVVYEIDVSNLTQSDIFLRDDSFSEINDVEDNKFNYFKFNNKVDQKTLAALLGKKM